LSYLPLMIYCAVQYLALRFKMPKDHHTFLILYDFNHYFNEGRTWNELL